MKKTFRSSPLLCALVAAVTVSAQAETFTGTTNSDPTVGSNYSGGTAPTFGGGMASPTGSGTFVINNQGYNAFVYSASLRTTVFSNYLYASGTNANNGLGTLNVTGGSLSFGGNSGGSGSQNVLGDGLVNLSGGTLSFLNGNTGSASSLWIGNNSGNGTVNVSGGTLITQNGIVFGRQGATGTLTLTGGLVIIEGTAGSLIGTEPGAAGIGILNLAAGIYEQTGSATISFSTGSHVNFTLGSTAQLSLNGATTASLLGLVTAGDIYINGVVDTNTADYQYTTSGAQGILSLPVPEPSAWPMIGVGLALLVWGRRMRAATSRLR